MTPPTSKFRNFSLLILAILAVWLAAPPTQAKDTWISVRTPNFLLVSNAGEKDVRQVATKLEQFRDVFTRLFAGAKFNTPVPTTVVLFKSASSYKPFAMPNASGYFQKGEDVNYITLSTDPTQNPFSTIYHEYVHLLVDNTSGNVPAWFNEGLAEYYSAFVIEEDRKVHLGELIPYHLLALREGKLYPLRTLFAVDHYSPEYNEGSKRGMFYAQSWALVHYLILANNGQHLPQLGKFLQLVARGTTIDDAFAQAFQTDIATLEKDLKKYVEGHTFRMQVATFEHKLEFESEMTTSALSEADAQAYLGDLLLHVNRSSDAESHLQQALTLDPKQPMALASLGILRARQGRFDEAQKHLQEAADANSNNYLVHYYYAYALSRQGMDANNMVSVYQSATAAKMRAELAKAIELNPAFPESYSLLAFVNTVTGEDLDGTIKLLNKALTLAPGRQDLSVMLAQVYLRQQKPDLAKQILEPLSNTKDRDIKRQAELILASIKRYEDAMARYNSGAPQLQQPKSGEPNEQPTNPMSESDYLRESLRPVEAGETRIQGLFVKLDCNNNGTAFFMIQSGDKLYKIRASALGNVHLISYVPGANQVGCGARKDQENVVVTFRPASDPKDTKAKIDGDVIAMEMVPKDFQLKPK